MLTGDLVGDFSKLSDQLLEHQAHRVVVDGRWVQVDACEFHGADAGRLQSKTREAVIGVATLGSTNDANRLRIQSVDATRCCHSRRPLRRFEILMPRGCR